DDLEMSGGCGVTQGRAGAGIVGDVVRLTVYQRRVLLEQLAHAFQIAHEAGGADIDVGAARAEMQPHVRWGGRPVSRYVAPAAKMVIAVRELNWQGTVAALGVDVRPAWEQLINHVELSGHDCPV